MKNLIQRSEELILNGLIHDKDFYRKVYPHLKGEYFGERTESILFDVIKEYSDNYNIAPSADTVSLLVNQKEGISSNEIDDLNEYISKLLITEVKTDSKFFVDETEKFCQEKAMYNAILDSMSIINGDDKKRDKNAIPELLKDALKISFNSNIGLEYSNAEERYDILHDEKRRLSFGLKALDIITKGGLSPKTLNVILAGIGVGKTLFMCHCAASAISQGKNVLYITMEMSEENISERIDANLMNIELDDFEQMDKETFLGKFKKVLSGNGFLSKLFRIKKKQKLGKLFIKAFPTGVGNANHFRFLLDELRLKKEFIAELVVVDYLNICSSVKVLPSAGMYSYVKSIAEEVRSVGIDYDVPFLSATQTNRGGINNSDLDMTDTSESIALPATTDLYIALSTSDLLEKSNRIAVKQLKNRYRNVNTNTYFMLGVEKAKMRLYHVDDWKKDINNSNLEIDEQDQDFINNQTIEKVKSENRFDGIIV